MKEGAKRKEKRKERKRKVIKKMKGKKGRKGKKWERRREKEGWEEGMKEGNGRKERKKEEIKYNYEKITMVYWANQCLQETISGRTWKSKEYWCNHQWKLVVLWVCNLWICSQVFEVDLNLMFSRTDSRECCQFLCVPSLISFTQDVLQN